MPLRLYQKKGYINMSNEINKIIEIIETNKVTETETDPFDEALDDNIILDDVYFSASRDAVTLDGMQFSFIKPPYMNFDDHIRVKRKLIVTRTCDVSLIYTSFEKLPFING